MRILYLLERPIQNDLPYQIISQKKDILTTVLCIQKNEGHLSQEENINQSVFADDKLYSFQYEFLNSSKSLASHIKKNDIVIVYGHFHPLFRKAILISKFLGKKLVLTSDASSLQGIAGSNGWMLKAKPFLFRFLYNILANAIFVPSTVSKNYFINLGIKREKIILTPYTINENFARDNIQNSKLDIIKQRLQISSNDTIFLFCGKLIPRKRPEDILRAAAKLDVSHCVIILIIGEGPEMTKLKLLAERMPLNVKIMFCGLVPYNELFNYYCISHATVIPADHEPYGLPVNESLFCGTPVIASDRVGAAIDLVEEGISGYVYPVSNIDMLAEKINFFITDKQHKEKMTTNCRKKMDHWNSSNNVEAQLAFFRSKGWIV